ncbi:MAG: cytidylate kinase family protein [Chloroflexi bacterium]|nr:cytidylate kinase family protein [Chloroflexota bacterium]
MAAITIARQLGSLGDEVAQALAERLGYRFVDKLALTSAAQAYSGLEITSGVPEIEEKKPSFWERLNEERHRYRVVLRSTMLEFAVQDRVVLLGMGGAYMLRDFSHVLRVFVTSPVSVRVDRIARTGTPQRPGPMDREAATSAIQHGDRERAGYARYLFNVDWLDPTRYDLVVNTSRLRVPEAVEILAGAVERVNLSLTPDSAERLHNETLASRVEATLLSNAGIWVHGLQVVAEGSVVHLSGEVITDEDREVAEELALRASGVTRVVNDLRIQPPPLTGM